MADVTRRPAGPGGRQVSTLALGSWNTWDRLEFDEVVKTLRLAVDAGVTLFDIGLYGFDLDALGDDATDAIFARALTAAGIRRDELEFAVKGWLPETKLEVAGLTKQLEAYLTRQSTDHVEFMVLGDLMSTIEDFRPVLGELGELIRSGKLGGWSVNNWSAEEIRRATAQAAELGVPAPEYAQLKYGFTRRSVPEGEPMRALGEETGLTLQASDTFEGGLLFETSTSRIIGGDIGGTQERIRASRARFREVAESLGATVAQLAIAFPLTNPQTSSVLIGSRTPEQTRENLGAFDLLQRHSAEDIRAAAEEFWFDRDVIDPASSWGTKPDDDPATYVVVER